MTHVQVRRITTTNHSMRVLGEHALELPVNSEVRAAITILLRKFHVAPDVAYVETSEAVAA